MRKLVVSFVALMLVAGYVGTGAAAFTDSANDEDNLFQSGTLNMTLSETDSNDDGIADTDAGLWADDLTAVWTSPLSWAPGDVFADVIFVRNEGTVDIQSLAFTMSDPDLGSSGINMAPVVNLADAWYDENANGVRDGGEGIVSELTSDYDANFNGVLTLEELYDGMTGAVGAFELEPGSGNFLPGSVTDPVIGGVAGTGKALHLEWEFDASADNTYQGADYEIDFDFTGSNIE